MSSILLPNTLHQSLTGLIYKPVLVSPYAWCSSIILMFYQTSCVCQNPWFRVKMKHFVARRLHFLAVVCSPAAVQCSVTPEPAGNMLLTQPRPLHSFICTAVLSLPTSLLSPSQAILHTHARAHTHAGAHTRRHTHTHWCFQVMSHSIMNMLS